MTTPYIMIKFLILFIVLTINPITTVYAKNSDFCVTDLRARIRNMRVRLMWSHNGSSTEYKIERSETNASEGFNEIDIIQTTSGTYVDKSIIQKKDYWYRILDNEGCPSTPVHVFFPKRKFNHYPSIESTPPAMAKTTTPYLYNAIGLDPEKKNLTWELDIAPAGMSIDTEKGTISWTPTTEFQDSIVSVLLRTTDKSGVSDQQFFTIEVSGQTRRTSCHTFFGPVQFKPTDLSQNNYYHELSVPSWIVPPYELHIFNGNPDGTQRISSATVEINGTQILTTNDINQTIAKNSQTVTLKRLNSMNTTLTGQQGSFLNLQVCGAAADFTPPQLTIVTPAHGSMLKNPTPTISVHFEDIAGALEPGASGIDISSLHVIIDNKDYTRVFTIGEHDASAVLPENITLTEGDHVLFAAVKDNANNMTSKTITFTYIPN